MVMKKYAIIDASNKAVNFVTWDGVTQVNWGTGNRAVEIPADTAYGHGWTWDGSTFVEPTPVVSVPKSITPRQCRLILLQQDLLASVEAMIAQQDEATRITWEFASEFKRDDPLLNQLGIALGLTQQQIDEFFIAAAQIA